MTNQMIGARAISVTESNSIKILRVIAALMIVATHICNAVGKGVFLSLSQLLQVSVLIFFIISAYLYSKRKAEAFNGKWLIKRILRLQIPVLIFDALWAIQMLLMSKYNFSFMGCISILMNLTGFHASMGMLQGTNYGNFWFPSYIMLCYMITPVIARLRDQFGREKSLYIVLFVFALYNAICMLFNAASALFYRFNYLFLYAVVFLNADSLVKPFSKAQKRYTLAITGVLILTAVARVFFSKGAVSPWADIFYTSVVAQLFNYILAIWICGFIFMIGKQLKLSSYAMKGIVWLDKRSYELYIAHGASISLVASFFQKGMAWVILEALVVYVTAILLASLLHAVSDPIYRKCVGAVAGKKPNRELA